jgi:hypothetical protein
VRGRKLSYRLRRRLVALVVVGFVAGGISAAIVLLPRGQKLDRGPTSIPPRAAQTASHRASHPSHLSAADEGRLRSTISLFISASVARHHPERSWSIVHPILREGLSKHQWSTGNIPVVPYPAVGVRLLRLESMIDETALVEVVLEPAPKSHLLLKTFQIELRRVPGPPHRWLVSSWVPEGVSQAQIDLDASTVPIDASANAHHFSSLWIFLPLGVLFGGVILIPTGLFLREAHQFRRAERQFRASADRGNRYY